MLRQAFLNDKSESKELYAVELTHTKSALSFKAVLRKAELTDVAALAEDQKKLEELSCSHAVLWADTYTAANSLVEEDKVAFEQWRSSTFQDVKATFTERLEKLSEKVFGEIRRKIEKATACTKPVALGCKSAEKSWKADLKGEPSWLDVLEASKAINASGLATNFKVLKKELG